MPYCTSPLTESRVPYTCRIDIPILKWPHTAPYAHLDARAEARETSNVVVVKFGLEVVIFFTREGSTLRQCALDLGEVQSPMSPGSVTAKNKVQHSVLGVGKGRNVFQEVDGAGAECSSLRLGGPFLWGTQEVLASRLSHISMVRCSKVLPCNFCSAA